MSQIAPKNAPKIHANRPEPPRPTTVSSTTLLGRAQELRILHEGREYRLRRTQNGRLILTA
ncbi:MAG: hemin uptake protein HemP [Gammaproteobacteria bacterium]